MEQKEAEISDLRGELAEMRVLLRQLAGAQAAAGPEPTLRELAPEYLTAKRLRAEAKGKPRTWMTLRSRLRALGLVPLEDGHWATVPLLGRELRDMRPSDLRHEHLDEYKAKALGTKTVRRTPRTLRTVQFEILTLVSMLNHLVKRKRVKDNPLRGYGIEKIAKKRRKRWTHEEGRAVVANSPNVYLPAVIAGVFRAGMRPVEVLELRDEQLTEVERNGETVGLVSLNPEQTKNSLGRETVLPPDALACFRRLPNWRKGGLLFENPSRKGRRFSQTSLGMWFRQACEYAGIKPAPGEKRPRLYDLKHSFITEMIEAGASVLVVAEMVGHQNLDEIRDTYFQGDERQKIAAALLVGRGLGVRLPPKGTPDPTPEHQTQAPQGVTRKIL